MADWDLLLRDARLATMRAGEPDYGIIEDAALAITDGSIAWLGAQRDLPEATAAESRSLHTCSTHGPENARQLQPRPDQPGSR